jgi:hypothetical protein
MILREVNRDERRLLHASRSFVRSSEKTSVTRPSKSIDDVDSYALLNVYHGLLGQSNGLVRLGPNSSSAGLNLAN